MIFTGFLKDGTKFLEEISQNNNKKWFENNKLRYKKLILEPSRVYVEDFGETLQSLVPTINAQPKIGGSLFKIYKDTRFTLNKEPIKTTIGILFWQGKMHRMQASSFYMHYNSNEVFYASGIRSFKPELLAMYREYIKDDTIRANLHKILNKLKSKGYLVCEPHYKRYPKGLDKDDIYSEYYLYNSMYAYKIFPLDDIFYSEKSMDRAYSIYDDMLALQQWVYALTVTNVSGE